MLFLDGAYLLDTHPPVFRRIAPPSVRELEALVTRIAERIGRALEREGLLARDCESSFLTFEPATSGPMDDLLGHSITYRVAVGPRTGQKAFTLQTVPAREEGPRKAVAHYAGFSLHAGIGIEAEQREKLERLANEHGQARWKWKPDAAAADPAAKTFDELKALDADLELAIRQKVQALEQLEENGNPYNTAGPKKPE